MNLDNAKHLAIDGKSAVRLAVGCDAVWKGLPKGYKKLDYIESTGTQYIDTGFYPNQDSRLVCEFLLVKGTNICGGRDTTNISNFSFRVSGTSWQGGYGTTVDDGYNALGSFTTVAVDNEWHVLDFNKNIIFFDGVSRRKFSGYAPFTSPNPVALGGILANKNGVKTLYEGYCRYRTCQIYDNGVLVRDLIPCKNADGDIGMYDTLNAVFYGNAGSGTFVAGAEV